MSKVLHPTADEFNKLLEEGTVFVDFYADWCGPCKMLAPELDKLAENFDGKLTVVKINVDHERDLAMKYGVSSIPALFILKNGTLVDKSLGYRPYPALSSWVEKNI